MALWGVCDVHVNVLYSAMDERCENLSVYVVLTSIYELINVD